MKRAFIIHGWGGWPDEGWFPWLKKELEAKGFVVVVPAMPDSHHPHMQAWIETLQEIVGQPDEEVFLIGHSLGCQAIVRYLETLDQNVQIGGAVLVAGFEHLAGLYTDSAEAHAALDPWLDVKIDWKNVRGKAKSVVCVFSDNDEYVPLSNVKVFEEKMNAKTRILHDRHHFSGGDGCDQLPEALEAIS